MRLVHACCLVAALCCSPLCCSPAAAQIEVADHELLPADRPEAWAMHYVTATTYMTGLGIEPSLAPGQWLVSAELGHIPRLSERQRRVGFDGVKLEDLNKSPVFGRIRLIAGLPGGWQAELAYTPPLEIDGARPRHLFAAALGRRLWSGDRATVDARVFGQHGDARGDITCPRSLAGVDDPLRNPYGCRAPSKDRIALNHYGIESTLGWQRDAWRWHASLGLVRSEPAVDVDALVFSVRDRSRLVTRAVQPYVALGATRSHGARWRLGLELLYVPLDVRRAGEGHSDTDALASLRVRLTRQGD